MSYNKSKNKPMNEQTSITETIKKVLPAVVSINISKNVTVFENAIGPYANGFEEFFVIPRKKKKIKVGGGSGFVVGSSGIVLTNRHVLEDPGAEYLVMLNDDRKFPVQVLAKDPINDVTILRIPAENLPVIELGDSSGLELGQTAIAFGNALGTFKDTVSVGVVSGLSREIMAGSAISGEITRLRGLIQTDAAINPGNSGGPLIDINGRAIGINAAMVFGAQSIGFALPINAAKKDLEDLKNFGRIRQPFLGLRYILVNRDFQEKNSLPVDYGALVVSEPIPDGFAVIPGGPAERAGLQEFDLILECQNEKISMENTLQDILQKFEIGQNINLKVLRKRKEQILNVILGEKR